MKENLKKVHVKTYGCQMNVYDSEKMVDLLKPHGFESVETPQDADVVIFNTCHIREKAEQKLYSDLGRIRPLKDNKEVLIGVAGCVAQAEGDEIIRQAPFVDMVFGPQTYHRLPELITKLYRQKEQLQDAENLNKSQKRKLKSVIDTDFPVESKFDTLPQTQESRASAFLSIQEGCDNFCTFCVVPYTRGAEYSRPVAEVIKEAKHLAEMGAKEITLLGQNVDAYHGESPNEPSKEWNLGQLIFEVAKINGIERIRYTTSHPLDMATELYEAHRDVPSLMPFLHLPVQSGSNSILKMMNRQHTAKDYLEVIEKLRKYRPDMAFSSDFIVGFPGESDQDHQDTLALIRAVEYSQAYSFKYSPRPGTPAAIMEQQVPEETKVTRLAELQNLISEQQLKFNQTFKDKTIKVLVDKTGKKEGQLSGRSEYMQSVYFDGPEELQGTMCDIKIEHTFTNSLKGQLS